MNDLIGRRFGCREVIGECKVILRKAKVVCRCDCGRVDVVEKGALLSGRSQKCKWCSNGRFHPRFRHGGTGTPTYTSFQQMHARCENPNHNRHDFYKNVSICDRWCGHDGFTNFLIDMGPKPAKHYSIDRIDNSGDYSPTNCRWATPKQQARNRHNAASMTADGVTKLQVEWAEELGIKYHTLRKRLHNGWTPEEVVAGCRASKLPGPRTKWLMIDGVRRPLLEWAAIAGVDPATFRARLNKLGWTPREAVHGRR